VVPQWAHQPQPSAGTVFLLLLLLPLHQVAELLAGVHAPVLYWEQGHEWIFGDPIRLQVRNDNTSNVDSSSK
jgi:hypothetical protein